MALIKVFERFADAEDARSELLAAGFAPYQIRLGAPDDEAGPVEGNFTVGNPDKATGVLESIINAFTGADHNSYERNYANPAFRGVYHLCVDAQDQQLLARAQDIMRRFGGVDPDTAWPARGE